MSGTNSAIYEGVVMHHRLRPRRHRFQYRVQSFLFELDALEQHVARCRWFSLNRFNLFSLYYRDFGDGSGSSPRQYLQQVLNDHGLGDQLARAQLLCYPRLLGYSFNPLSIYYCYDHQDRLFALLYEVSNTFSQRHSYLLPVDASQNGDRVVRQNCDKNFYVSPFISMDCHYHFRVNRPGQNLMVAIRQHEQAQPLLNAVFSGQYRPLCDRELLKGFGRMPLMTLKIMTAIHWQALKLFLKGVRLVPRPDEPSRPISRTDP